LEFILEFELSPSSNPGAPRLFEVTFLAAAPELAAIHLGPTRLENLTLRWSQRARK
jgi:hypothetical protein